MTEQKHTPGPWVIIPGGDEWSSGRIATIEPKPETMVETNYWTVAEVNYRRDEHAANAKLIAAAPDLLAELTVLRDTLPHVGLPAATRVEMLRRIEAVIAKATQ